MTGAAPPGAVLALVALSGCTHPAPAHPSPHPHHRFEKAEEWATRFDDPKRDAWQKPDEVIRALGLKPGDRIADLGAGTGYFTVRLARAVPDGRVYGVDIEPDMVRHLSERAAKSGLPNVTGVLATPDDPRLPEPVHLVLVVDTYHHLEERPRYFAKLRDQLLPGGKVAIIDFRRGAPLGPPDAHKVPAEQVIQELQSAGYTLSVEHELLPHQHFLVFVPKG